MSAAITPVRRALVTSLDVLVAILAGIGLLMALGAHTRVTIGHTVISAASAWRPFVAAAVLLALRLALRPRLRLLPSLVDPALQARLEAEHRWLAEPAAMPRAARFYAGGVIIVSLLWFIPHLTHIRRVPDAGDPLFSAWRVARVAHQLTHDPLHLFDGNIFYPEPYTLTYSDATFLEGVVATPFIVAGLDPLVVANAIFLSAFPLCGLAFFYSGWRLTADLRAGFVAGVLGALYPFHLEHYSHLELQFFCFVPLAVVALLRLLAAPQWKRGLVLGVLVALQWLACMYFGVMLPIFLLPIALVALVAWRVKPTRDLVISMGVAVVVAAIGFSILAVPYMRSRGARGERDLRIVSFYSAVPGDYGRAHQRLASYGWLERDQNKAERELFPGVGPLALGLIGMLPPMPLAVIATIGGTALAFDGSLGNGGLVYDDLYRYLVPFRGMRVPARFSALVGCGLILLSAFGARRLIGLSTHPRIQMLVFAALVLAILVDLRPRLDLQDYPPRIPSIYSAVSSDMVLAEFPFEDAFDYLYFSTFHWPRLVNGYSGYTPDSYLKLRDSLEPIFPSAAAIDILRRRGVTHLTINCAMYRWREWNCDAALATLDSLASLEVVSSGRWERETVRLYRLR